MCYDNLRYDMGYDDNIQHIITLLSLIQHNNWMRISDGIWHLDSFWAVLVIAIAFVLLRCTGWTDSRPRQF